MAEPEVINWCCGEHPFRLRIGEAEALDDLTGQGMLDFRWRIATGLERGSLAYSPVKVREVVECIRLGLIGGSMDSAQARKLALRAFEEGEFSELVTICFTITSSCLAGKDHDTPGKPVAAEATPTG